MAAAPLPDTGVAAPGPPQPPPAERTKRDTAGLSASVGFGPSYALVGLQLAYYLPVRPRLTLVAHLAGSRLDRGSGRKINGGSLGLSAVHGWGHRVLFDAGFGVVDGVIASLHGTVIDRSNVYGPYAGVGYEYLSGGGLIVKAQASLVYCPRGPVLDAFVADRLDLGLGYKFW